MHILELGNLYQNLEVFCAVVDSKSFSAASQILKITQSSVSRRVKELELELGKTLIRRNSRNLEITTDGNYIYKLYREQNQELQLKIGEFKSDEKPKGVVKVLAPEAVFYRAVTPYIARFIKQYPDITLELVYQSREVDLVKENFSFAIINHEPAQQTSIARFLGSQHIQLYCTPQYAECYGVPSTPEEITQHNTTGFINPNNISPECVSVTNMTTGEIITIQNPKNIRTNSVIHNQEMALSGELLAFGNDAFFSNELAEGSFIKVLPEYSFAEYKFFLLKVSRHNSRATELFIDFVLDCLKPYFPRINNQLG